MFSTIYKGNIAQLLTLGREIYLRDHNKPAALLCFDHCFRDIDKQTAITGSPDEILNRTRSLCDYAELAHEIFFVPEPRASQGIQKLFSFTVHSGGHICLPRHTFLHSAFKSSPNRRRQVSNEDASVDVRRFCELYQTTLRERLRERLKLYSDNSLSVRIFDPCDTSFSKRRCERTGCQRQHELNHAWFEKRLYFHMFQISILHTLQFFSRESEQRSNIRRFGLLLLICCLSLTGLKLLVRASLRHHQSSPPRLWIFNKYQPPCQPTNLPYISSLVKDFLDLAYA
jgi:hypothetical protein